VAFLQHLSIFIKELKKCNSMELHTLLGEVVKTHGRDIINDQRVVNILSDYNVYADNPQFKFIIKNIISEGYSNKILDIQTWDLKADQMVEKFIRTTGIDLQSAQYVFKSMAFSVGANVNIGEISTLNIDSDINTEVRNPHQGLLGYLENINSIKKLCAKLSNLGFEKVKEVSGNLVYSGEFLNSNIQMLIMKSGFSDLLHELNIFLPGYVDWTDCKREYHRIKDHYTREYGKPVNYEFVKNSQCDGSGREIEVLDSFDDAYACVYNLDGLTITVSIIIGSSKAAEGKPVASTRVHYKYDIFPKITLNGIL